MDEIINLSKKFQICIIDSSRLKEQEMQDIQQLVHFCQQHDGISLSCPLDPDDEAQHFLLYGADDGCRRLFSVLSILQYDGETVECYAFTHPAHRQQGYFSELLAQVLEQTMDCDILFPVSGKCPDTLAALETLEAELESEELQMELELHAESMDEMQCGNAVNPDFTLLPVAADPEEGMTEWTFYQGFSHKKRLGSCRTSVVSDTCICLHHVEILPEFRGLGYSSLMMERLIGALRKQGFARIILQVSGDNHAALSLYKKQGFRITETLSFYLY